MRIVHYLNQFFGGQGGEAAANLEPRMQDGAVGPGKLLEQVLGEEAQIVRTIIAGDNYAAEHLEALTELVLKEISAAQAELFVAGPCFEAGRYGVAAGGLCAAVQAELGIPVVTGMAVENPGVDLYRQELYIVDSGASVSAMREVLTTMGRIAVKLARNQDIGRPSDAGYIPSACCGRRSVQGACGHCDRWRSGAQRQSGCHRTLRCHQLGLLRYLRPRRPEG